MVLGLRGIPDVQGGIEKHVEKLCPLLQRMGCDLEVIVRTPYVRRRPGDSWNGIRLLRIWSPKSKFCETIIHTFVGVLVAAVKRPDLLHIHAVGPAIMVPLARLFGLRVVVTHHGADYEREKWGGFAKFILRAGEACGMLFGNQRIAISQVIRHLIKHKYAVDCEYIPNGTELPELPTSTSALTHFGLQPQKYVLMVGRLVREKRQADLIAAFNKVALDGWKLVLVGDSEHATDYTRAIRDMVADSTNIVMTGVQTGLTLQELYTHAGAFVLPSSHEGLPIALMEALSYRLPIIASDIPANLEIGLDRRSYFRMGDVDALARMLQSVPELAWSRQAIANTRRCLETKQTWQSVAESTISLYRKAAQPRRRGFTRYVTGRTSTPVSRLRPRMEPGSFFNRQN
jgi:glycosyltransferase involved in cell wall biosynthesis